MKYYIITYGCQMNKSDSERIAQLLESQGYKTASNENEADLIVVNMCSVRQSAVDRVYGLTQKLKNLKTKNPKLKTILTGCILKQDKEKLKNNFDLILNIKDLPNWPKILNKKTFVKLLPWQEIYEGCDYLKIHPKYQNNLIAFIPISTGCNNFCSYCVVPFTRGPLVCRNYKDILKEVKKAVKKGFKEIWLLGQNVNDYSEQNARYIGHSARYKSKFKSQKSKVVNFAKLLKMVNEIEGDFWIRFTSPHPKNFSDELIETMAKCQKVTPYLNLPLQSGDDEILRRMNRNYTAKEYKNLVKKIRKAFKKYRKGIEREVAISTDIIVGFPGETKKQFENTKKLMKEIKFDMAYIAQYSPRPQTAAEKMEDYNPPTTLPAFGWAPDVPKEEKERRWKILTDILKKTALEKNKKFIGKEILVLPEEKKNGFLIGKSRHYKTVKFEGNESLIGNFVKVKIEDALSWGLKGKLMLK